MENARKDAIHNVRVNNEGLRHLDQAVKSLLIISSKLNDDALYGTNTFRQHKKYLDINLNIASVNTQVDKKGFDQDIALINKKMVSFWSDLPKEIDLNNLKLYKTRINELILAVEIVRNTYAQEIYKTHEKFGFAWRVNLTIAALFVFITMLVIIVNTIWQKRLKETEMNYERYKIETEIEIERARNEEIRTIAALFGGLVHQLNTEIMILSMHPDYSRQFVSNMGLLIKAFSKVSESSKIIKASSEKYSPKLLFLELTRKLSTSFGAEIETDFETETDIEIDFSFLRFIVSELLINSITHGRKGCRINLVVTTSQSGVKIKIINKVKGKLNLENFGLPFYKNRKESEGFGLGLFAIKRLLALQGGRIEWKIVTDELITLVEL